MSPDWRSRFHPISNDYASTRKAKSENTVRLGKCGIKNNWCLKPLNPPPYQHYLGRAGGCCGSLILWIDPACQELTDPFYSARDQTLYLGMRKRSERLVKHRWNCHTPALALILIRLPCLARFGAVGALDIRRGQVHQRQRGWKASAQGSPLPLQRCLVDIQNSFMKYISVVCSYDSRAANGVMYLADLVKLPVQLWFH